MFFIIRKISFLSFSTLTFGQMKSIEAIKLQLDSHLRDLNEIRNSKVSDPCVFVGAGDSYAAGLIAEFLTDHRCKCYSPSDLLNSRLTDEYTYCFISVTGKTKSNIIVAERAAEAGAKTIAITLNKNSKLAQICEQAIPVKITEINTPSDFITFLANVITSLQVGGVAIPQKFDVWHKEGMRLALNFSESILLPLKDPIFFLGNNLSYCFALYASLKVTEYFGITTIPHKLEEFCHSPIFGAKKSNSLWIFGQNEKPISLRLEKLGLDVHYFELYNEDILARSFQSIFFLQNLILLLAKRQGLTRPRYLLNKEKLKTSSELIYY